MIFGPFRLDLLQNRLWREAQPIALRPQALAVLRYLVLHSDRLVTKAELFQHVWDGRHVTDTVLRGCIHAIRAALTDTAETPQYLETVGRQGYRFRLGRVAPRLRPPDTRPVVGRQGEVEWLPNVAINLEGGSGYLVNAPRKFAEIIGTLMFWGGANRLIWPTGYIALHPRAFVEAFWRFKMPKDLMEDYGFPPLTPDVKQATLSRRRLPVSWGLESAGNTARPSPTTSFHSRTSWPRPGAGRQSAHSV